MEQIRRDERHAGLTNLSALGLYYKPILTISSLAV